MSRRHENPRALVDNMADEGQVATALETTRTLAEQARDSWISVLSTYEGRHVIDLLMEHCGPFRSVLPGSTPIDPLSLASNAGKQDVGHFLFAEVQSSGPQFLSLIMQEHHDRESDHG